MEEMEDVEERAVIEREAVGFGGGQEMVPSVRVRGQWIWDLDLVVMGWIEVEAGWCESRGGCVISEDLGFEFGLSAEEGETLGLDEEDWVELNWVGSNVSEKAEVCTGLVGWAKL